MTNSNIQQRKANVTEQWRDLCSRLELANSTSERAQLLADIHRLESQAMRLILAEQPLDGEPAPAWLDKDDGKRVLPSGGTGCGG